MRSDMTQIAHHSLDYVFRRTVDMYRRYTDLLQSGEVIPNRSTVEDEADRCYLFIQNHKFQYTAILLQFEVAKAYWGGESGY